MNRFIQGDGIAARLIRDTDWSRTSVGAIDQWPSALKTVVSVILNSRQPMFLWWGPDLIQFYNDAYIPSFGVGKHPMAMGQRGADCWQEIWPIIWPQIEGVMKSGTATWHENQLVPIRRNGRIEDVYWTYGYSAVPGKDGDICGTLVVCSETTATVVAERRQQASRALADRVAASLPGDEVLLTAAKVLLETSEDVPAVLFYRQLNAGQPVIWQHALAPDPERLEEADKCIRSRLVEAMERIAAGEPVLLNAAINLPSPPRG
jgi:hypothetical protein